MSNYEYFQNNNGESDLKTAYNSTNLTDTLHNVPFCNANNNGPLPPTSGTEEQLEHEPIEQLEQLEQEPIEKSTMSNLWDFLGLSNLSTRKKECLFDCSIHGARCLERCKFKDPDKCKYRCLKHGLYCSKKCVMLPKKKLQTTHSGNDVTNNRTTHSGNDVTNKQITTNTTRKYPPVPFGDKNYFMGYAPFDSNLWPSFTQSGWDMDKLNKHHTDDFIEVLVPNNFIFPNETAKPNLIF
mgnify:CR=1 FL=1